MLWRRMGVLMIVLLTACAGTTNPTSVPSTTVPTMATLTAKDLQGPDDVLNYYVAHQDDVAIVSYSVNADGSMADDAPVVMHHANEPMALASTMKILALAGYAWEVEHGTLDPQTAVTLEEWQRWYLPGTDGNAHPQALKILNIPADDQGFATPTLTVTLDQVVSMMITVSDNAATDLVLDRLAPDTISTVLKEAGIEGQALPESLLGNFLIFWNIDQMPTLAHVDALAKLSPSERQTTMQRLIDDYSTRHTDYLAWIASEPPLPDYALMRTYFQNQATHGTAAGYAEIMAKIATNNFISPAISKRMQAHLDWPMDIEGNDTIFAQFGAKGGSLPGILTSAMYMAPKDGPWQNRMRVVVAFQRNLNEADWNTFMQTFIHQSFELELGLDPDFAQRVAETLKQP